MPDIPKIEVGYTNTNNKAPSNATTATESYKESVRVAFEPTPKRTLKTLCYMHRNRYKEGVKQVITFQST